MDTPNLTPEVVTDIKKEVATVAKNEGLHAAEETAVALVKAAFNILKVVLPKVSPIAAAIIVPGIAFIEPKVIAALDKIDGVQDQLMS